MALDVYWNIETGGLQTFAWLCNLAASIAGLFISLFLYISHEDMDYDQMEPAELADHINTYLPIEYALSQICLVTSMLAAPWYVIMTSIPLALYNIYRFK